MPAVAKTSVAAVVAAAREILEESGMAGLTMQSVAQRVGIRGPSLYKRFADRNALMPAIEADVILGLARRLAEVAEGKSDRGALVAIAEEYRAFARESPVSYTLLFTVPTLEPAEAVATRLQALRPVLAPLTRLLGDPDAAFVRARTLTAFLHGFAHMESGVRFGWAGA